MHLFVFLHGKPPENRRFLCLFITEHVSKIVAVQAALAEGNFVGNDGIDLIHIALRDLHIRACRGKGVGGGDIGAEIGLPIPEQRPDQRIRIREHVPARHQTGVELQAEQIALQWYVCYN